LVALPLGPLYNYIFSLLLFWTEALFLKEKPISIVITDRRDFLIDKFNRSIISSSVMSLSVSISSRIESYSALLKRDGLPGCFFGLIDPVS